MCYPPATHRPLAHDYGKERSHLMHKIVMGIFVMLIASSVKAQEPMVATDITAAQVQAFIKDAPHDRNSDRPIRVIDVGGYRVGVFGVFRPKDTPPSVTVHQTNVTETYYMLEGAGVLVTGGTLRKPLTPRPSNLGNGNWTDIGSDGIEGGVPHGWASLEGDITYLIVRSDPDKKLPLK